jgi:carbamoyltransferase
MSWTLGVNTPGHGASICLFKDTELVLFLKEERVTRIKRDCNVPLRCLDYVKNYTDTIDHLVFTNGCHPNTQNVESSLEKLGIKFNYDDQYENYQHKHHFNHAACGFYGSGFDEAICLVMDGWGYVSPLSSQIVDGEFKLMHSDSGQSLKLFETCSIFHAKYPLNFDLVLKFVNYDGYRFDALEDNFYKISQIQKDLKNQKYIINTNVDVGIVYEIITKFLGFDQDDCGKTMGMSAYGEEDSEVPPFFCNENLDVNMNLFTNSSILNDVNYPEIKNFTTTFKKRCNLAYATQKALEKKVLKRVDMITKYSNCKNIVLSGGIFQNVVLNSVIVEKYPEYNFYVDPLCDDSGHAYSSMRIGASKKVDKNKPLKDLYLGPKYEPEDLKNRIHKEVSKKQNK